MPTQPTIIVRGGCAHVLAGQKQCRDCEAFFALMRQAGVSDARIAAMRATAAL